MTVLQDAANRVEDPHAHDQGWGAIENPPAAKEPESAAGDALSAKEMERE